MNCEDMDRDTIKQKSTVIYEEADRLYRLIQQIDGAVQD